MILRLNGADNLRRSDSIRNNCSAGLRCWGNGGPKVGITGAVQSNNAAEIAENEIQCKGMAVILKLLAEGIREPREPPHAHSHGEVLSLGT